jgi:hypothetical protein
MANPMSGAAMIAAYKEAEPELKKRFGTMLASDSLKAEIDALNHSFFSIAMTLTLCTPFSREHSLALTDLETAKFWAVAALARNGLDGGLDA